LTRLRREFFERYTPRVAKDLLGCRLMRVDRGTILSGIIVETEAYRGLRDPASHAYRGKTPRNEVMFGPAGCAYVYFTMGVHYCLNVTTELPGDPGAVLLRAIEPVEGVSQMVRNRGVDAPVHVADGPGRLTRALGIDRRFNGEDLTISDALYIESGVRPSRIGISSRVGISRAVTRKWRFFVAGSKFVSSGKPAAAGAQNP
jgi:DNA-3-methyladenine glycosylase